MRNNVMGWFWRFTGGVLNGLTAQTDQTEGEVPRGIIVYPSCALNTAEKTGYMPVPDTIENRELLRNKFYHGDLHLYRRIAASEITDEQYAEMNQENVRVARGAQYEYIGHL